MNGLLNDFSRVLYFCSAKRTLVDGEDGEQKAALYCKGHLELKGKGTLNVSGNTAHAITGNDAVDSNYGKTGAITIGDGLVFAYTTKGDSEEGLDCDNDSYIQISGNGYAISAGGQQGSGGGWGGSSSSSISNASQGYAITSSPSSYSSSNYYTMADSEGNNLLTYKFDATVSNKHSIITAKGMVKDNDYTIKSSTSAPTDATESFHGIYLGSSAVGNTDVTSFTAKKNTPCR